MRSAGTLTRADLAETINRKMGFSRAESLALVEAILAQNTNMANATRGYRMLRRRLPTWTKVMNARAASTSPPATGAIG